MCKRKQIVALLLVFILALPLLAACGNSGVGTPAQTSDTVLWINATHAVLTAQNGHNVKIFGGLAPTKQNKELVVSLLDEWWGVTDRATADSTLAWLLNEGHRADFISLMKLFDEENVAALSSEERLLFMQELYKDDGIYYAKAYENYLQYGEHAIDGWDYSRAISLLGWYHIAGYYTEAEALDRALEVAKTVQTAFTSWDAFVESYFMGYEYWASAGSEQRRTLYDTLKSRNNGPYSIPWDMELKKDW